jgi:hypothetical protein
MKNEKSINCVTPIHPLLVAPHLLSRFMKIFIWGLLSMPTAEVVVAMG